MASRSASQKLSPRLLKHFAAATAALTLLIAVLASGEDWGARAQVDAVEARNQLAATEAEKLGTKKVAKTLKVANTVGAARFGDDERETVGDGGGYARPAPLPVAATSPYPGQRKPGPPSTSPTEPPLPGSEQQPASFQPSSAPAPSRQDIANITASSARRSGGAQGGD